MRKILLIVIGLMIAGLGTVLLVSAVDEARDRAGVEPAKVEVLVVRTLVPRLTAVEEVRAAVEARFVAADAVVPGSLRSLDDLDPSLVTNTELLPGEQVLAARFIDPRAAQRQSIPAGLQEVTISLDADRVLGGSVIAGDLVGVVTSLRFEAPADPRDNPPPGLELTFRCGATSVCLTDFVLNQVLVTSVQYTRSDVGDIEASAARTDASVTGAPQGKVFVTLAVNSEQATALVYGLEFGSLWLTRQNADTAVGTERPITLDRLFAVKQ
jgi:pilus assembly protein CpaB